MGQLSHHELTIFLLALGVLLAAARILGELAKRFHQPAVLGEIVAGILLGPTVLGHLAPELSRWLFPHDGNVPIALDGLTTLSITLFLLVAGMEVDLSTVWRQGRTAFNVSLAGIAFPFALGFALARLWPAFFGALNGNHTIFALFFATALSISALPVIAKILMDLNLYRSDMGMVVIAAAILNDLAGWIVFATLLGLIDAGAGDQLTPLATIALTVGFAVAMLTAGRWLLDRALPWIQAHTSWPGGVLGFAMFMALFCAALTQWIGVHPLFGAFLFGVALGDSSHLRENTRATIDHFASFIFAPLFFASIGLKVDFVRHFDPLLVVAVLVAASVCKIAGCGWGARRAGMGRREALAVGFGMNARGAMEIVLGLIALQAGVIGERLFVALVVMALVTSMTSGAAIQRLLRRKKPARLTDFLAASAFRPRLRAANGRNAIGELSAAACQGRNLDPVAVADAVWEREQLMSTSLANALAVPHARLENLAAPIIAVGLSKTGVDFNSEDGQPARLIVLILTPRDNDSAQLEILADIGRTFREPAVVEKALRAANYTEFLALMRSEAGHERR